ncbi:MAG: creatininase family protein [Opitutaceae bacterium]|jgi:creatinine amidohydrolase
MSPLWIANADPATAWAHQTWSDLAARVDKSRVLVVLPVHGFADHGFGLPLDVEETVGSALLRSALTAAALKPYVLVLPPLRFGAAPYAHTRFGIDAETALETLNEIVASVKASGFTRVLFFNTSPWNTELVATAALDARTSLDLSTYVIGAAGLGLGFHPADVNRVRTQAVACGLLGRTPAESAAPGVVCDTDFRPGFYAQPAPVTPDVSLSAAGLFAAGASKLADLLGEIVAHKSGLSAASTPVEPSLFSLPTIDRSRELAALTAAELAAIPDKEQALVIIPTGAIEQHGHHLPLGTDAILGRLWLAHTLPRLAVDAPVFVAPPITYGKSNEHLGFAGTLTISARTLRRQLLALAADLKSLGFRQLAILNTHGGNSATVVATLREIQAMLGLRAGMFSGHYRPVQTPQESAFGFHAGEWETSLMLAGAPELVHMDRAVCEYPAHLDVPGGLRPEGGAAVFAWKTSDISQSGVMGDATIATAEKGVRWLDEASAALARKIESLLAPEENTA